MFKILALKFLKSKLLKGKLTYAGVGVVALPLVAKLLGIDLGADEVTQLMQAAGLLVTIAGRIRAAHQA